MLNCQYLHLGEKTHIDLNLFVLKLMKDKRKLLLWFHFTPETVRPNCSIINLFLFKILRMRNENPFFDLKCCKSCGNKNYLISHSMQKRKQEGKGIILAFLKLTLTRLKREEKDFFFCNIHTTAFWTTRWAAKPAGPFPDRN